MILTADVGATKAVVGIFAPGANASSDPIAYRRYVCSDFPNLIALLRDFLEIGKYHIHSAVIGVAGPVINDEATISHLNWPAIVESDVAGALEIESVKVINDVEALAYVLPKLDSNNTISLRVGSADQHGPRAILAAGTGLGEAYSVWHKGKYEVRASEGGHSDFAPVSRIQSDLLSYARPLIGRVSADDICSGRGLGLIYGFLRDYLRLEEPAWIRQELDRGVEAAYIICDGGYSDNDLPEIILRAREVFAEALLGEAGNLALKMLATGGVFIGGGLPPRLASSFTSPVAMNAFLNRRAVAAVLDPIPLFLITNPDAGLLGALEYARQNHCADEQIR
jgi:glucokinase